MKVIRRDHRANFLIREMSEEQSARRRPRQRYLHADFRADAEWPPSRTHIGNGVFALMQQAELRRLAGLECKPVDFCAGAAKEVMRAQIAHPIEVQRLAEEDLAV